MAKKKAAKVEEEETQPEAVVFNIADHVIVPKHIRLSDQERDQFLKDNGLKFTDLPKILVSDAAVEPLQAKSGDVIRIERRSPTAGRSIFYRGVVDEQ